MTDDNIKEVINRTSIVDIINSTIPLKKKGNNYFGLSPFKKEKTPSFSVNEEKKIFHCFSTGEHGNIFDFVMKTQNLKFGEAVKMLANLAGIRAYTFSRQDEERQKKWFEYKSIYSKYIDIYHNELLNNEEASKAKNYLKKRNLDLEQVKNFKIGYVTSNIDTYEIFKKDFNEKDLNECGLFYFDEKNKKFIERFRDRLIFPIKNISGDAIALGGRIIDENKYLAKYINSPETHFFKKGSNLFNLDKARKLSNKVENIFLVEGYMDVIGLYKNNIENVVANLGTALTIKQIVTLNQFFNHIVICFDGDDSGYKAALRAAENTIVELQPEKKISFLFLPDNHDPDSFANKYGKEYFLEFSKKESLSIHDFIFNHYYKITEKNPSSLALFEKKLRSVATTIKDEYIKKYILEYFLEKISDLTPNINKKNKKNYVLNTKSLKKTKDIFIETKSLTSIEIKEFSLLYILINKPEIIQNNNYILEEIKFFSKENKMIFEKLLNHTNNFETIDLENLNIDKSLIERINKYASIRYILSKNLNDEHKLLEILKEIVRDLKNYELEFRIAELESRFSKDLSEVTFNELKELKKQQKIN